MFQRIGTMHVNCGRRWQSGRLYRLLLSLSLPPCVPASLSAIALAAKEPLHLLAS